MQLDAASRFSPDSLRTPTASVRAGPSSSDEGPFALEDRRPRRPQAFHRYLERNDFRWGCDPFPPSPPRRTHRRKVSAAPSLPTILEDWRLRCRRVELGDTTEGSQLRFSGIYCPPCYSAYNGRPVLENAECLENFAVLRPQRGGYVNVTQTMQPARKYALYAHALIVFREAFACGLLK